MEKTILIIDDDEDLSFIMAEMLKGYGYKVTCVNNGEKAFDILAKKTFSLIL
ncbi:MAG: response regulator, partial [Lachnospira sp.]|nr:response regulator [Lachnospira sp.]